MLSPERPAPPHKRFPIPPAITRDVDQLSSAGLYRQARRLIDQELAGPADAVSASALSVRSPWLKKLRDLSDRQQAPALKELLAAKKSGAGASAGTHVLWTIREILTDPERIGQYIVEPSVPQREFDARATSMRLVELLDDLIVRQDFSGADRQAAMFRRLLGRSGRRPRRP